MINVNKRITYMRSQPNDWMEIWLFAFEEGFVCRLKVGVFEELPSVPTQPLYVLVVGLLESSLQAPIHSPVPANVPIKSRTAYSKNKNRAAIIVSYCTEVSRKKLMHGRARLMGSDNLRLIRWRLLTLEKILL